MTAYFSFVLRNRLLVVLICVLITGAAAANLSRAVVASSPAKMFFGNSAEYDAYQVRARTFTNDEIFIVAYDDPAPLSARSLDRLEKVVSRVESMPEVARVESLLNAQRTFNQEDTLVVEAYGEAARANPQRSVALQEILRRDEQFRGLLISADGRHAAVIVELTVNPERHAEVAPGMVAKVIGEFHTAGYPARTLHTAGFLALLAELMDLTFSNLAVLFPILVVVLLVVVFFLFRRLAPVALTMTVSLLAVFWTMGFSVLLDRELSIMTSVVPAVIMIVAFSDIIHLWSAYLLERRRGKERHEAIMASAIDVGTACLYTSATTFVGFICLSAVPTPVFRQIGLILGFGVGVALVLAMTLVPMALSVLRNPEGKLARKDRLSEVLTSRGLATIARLATARPWLVIGAFALLSVLAAAGLLRLNIDTDLNERMAADSRYREDLDYVAKHFADTNLVEVFVDTDRDNALLDADLFARIAAYQDALEARPEVDKAVSLVTVVERLHKTLGGEGRLPRTRGAIAQYLLLFEMSGGEDLKPLVDFKRRSMRIALRLNDHGVRGTYEAGLAASRLGTRMLGSRARVETSGMSYLVGWWLGSIVDGQRNGLLLSFALIAVMMIIAMRSFRVGLGSMIPNLLPLFCLGAYMGTMYDRVDSDLLIIAMMAIGIGVDDTIHFLMRYRIEAARSRDRAQALQRTFAFSGRAILLTTVVLVLGFLPLALSNYFPIRMMGMLIPGVLVVALAADLLLVAALVQVGPLAMDKGKK